MCLRRNMYIPNRSFSIYLFVGTVSDDRAILSIIKNDRASDDVLPYNLKR